MAREPRSKFFRVVMIIEVPEDHSEYPDDDRQLYMVGRLAEKAIDTNTGMTAWPQEITRVQGK